MIRIVPDTNIILSAVFWRGNENKIISKGIDGDYRLVTSPEIIEEVIDKLKSKFNFPEDKLQDLVDIIFTYYDIVDPVSKFNIVRDVKDNKILECAFDGKAEFIITGDKDLLVLEEYKGIKIVTSGDFLENISF